MKSNYSELVAIHVMFLRCMHALFRQCYQWYKEGIIPSEVHGVGNWPV